MTRYEYENEQARLRARLLNARQAVSMTDGLLKKANMQHLSDCIAEYQNFLNTTKP